MSPLHTDKEYEMELARLREKVLFMGAKVESMIATSMAAFDSQDLNLARQTIELDHEINRLEVDIDGYCLSILARRQPVASDLRMLTTALKLVTDLERMGDLAVNICERILDMAIDPPRKQWPEMLKMAEIVQGMVRDALDAFVAGDSAKAAWVIERDRSVDAIYAQLFRQILMVMMEDKGAIQRGMGVQAIAKYIERIGDHATNLAEMVVFLTQGRDIRHPESIQDETH